MRDLDCPRSSPAGLIRPSRSGVPLGATPLVPSSVQETVLEHTVLPGSTWQDLFFGEMIGNVTTWSAREIRSAILNDAPSKSSRDKQSLFNMLCNKRRRNTNRRWK